jgi:hypothetical protein
LNFFETILWKKVFLLVLQFQNWWRQSWVQRVTTNSSWNVTVVIPSFVVFGNEDKILPLTTQYSCNCLGDLIVTNDGATALSFLVESLRDDWDWFYKSMRTEWLTRRHCWECLGHWTSCSSYFCWTQFDDGQRSRGWYWYNSFFQFFLFILKDFIQIFCVWRYHKCCNLGGSPVSFVREQINLSKYTLKSKELNFSISHSSQIQSKKHKFMS